MESITLNSGGSESDGTLAVTIAINTYYQPLSNSRPSSESEDLPMLTKSDQDIYSKLQSYTSYQLDGSAPIQQEEPPQASQSATPALREAPETSPSATP
jgi:hypothetical protein